MTLTAEERAEISRENGRRSKGPTSEVGKRRSSENALKDGLRARTLPLPHEDQNAVAALAEEYHSHYRPSSPITRHLINDCIRANLLADRCDRDHHNELQRQVEDADRRWDQERCQRINLLRQQFRDDSAAAVAGLKG